MTARKRGADDAAPEKNRTPPSYHTPARRQAVLVVLHSDGWCETYADRHVDIHVAIVPYVGTPEGERLASEYLDVTLPRRYRDLYWPSKCRATGQVRAIRPSDITVRECGLALLDALDAMQHRREGQIWIA